MEQIGHQSTDWNPHECAAPYAHNADKYAALYHSIQLLRQCYGNLIQWCKMHKYTTASSAICAASTSWALTSQSMPQLQNMLCVLITATVKLIWPDLNLIQSSSVVHKWWTKIKSNGDMECQWFILIPSCDSVKLYEEKYSTNCKFRLAKAEYP